MSFVGRVFKMSDSAGLRFFVVLDEFKGKYFDQYDPVECVSVLWSFGKTETFPVAWIEEDGDIEIHG